MEHGYHLARQLFHPDRIREVKADMEKIFSLYTSKPAVTDEDIMQLFADDFDGFYGCAMLCQKLISLSALATSAEILGQLESFGLRFPTFNTKPLVSFSSSRTAKHQVHWKVPAHQDWPSNLGSTNGVTCWLPLVDVDQELGCLEIWPDSHLNGPIPHDMEGVPVIPDYSEEGRISVPMQVGDALFFNTMTVHRSGHNATQDRIRWSMHFRYNDATEPSFIERKYPRNRTER